MKGVTTYLIPNTHSDLQYLKSYREYLPLHLSNLKKGLDILDKYPEYTYLTEQIAVLEEFWKRFPKYREKIKRFAQEGRLEITPNMYCICDMNIPCGESLIQQAYYGKKWTKKCLGVESKTAWIADSFGLNWQLPQILKGCGYLYCAFVRGIDNPERKSEFIWEGLDKTQILTHWLIFGYGGIGSFSEDKKKDFIQLEEYIGRLKKHSTFSKILLGNGGDFVTPNELSCIRVKEWNKKNGEKIIFSTPSKYFSDLLKENPKLEILKEEFNPVFKGCYSSRIKLKQKNRSLENKVMTTEKLSVLASFLGRPYPFKELDKAWKKILFYQFHDTISGTIVDSAYEETLKGYREAEESLNKIFFESVNFFTNKINGHLRGILIFNPLCWERTGVIKIKDNGLQPKDSTGKLILYQKIKEGNSRFLLFTVKMPSLGYKIFNLVSKKRSFSNTFKVEGNQIENRFYKIKLSDNGVISSLILKKNGLEYVDQKRPFFNDLVIQDDNGDLWLLYESPLVDSLGWGFARDNWEDPIPTKPKFSRSGKRQIGFFRHSKDIKNKVEIIEKGPVRLAIKVEGALSFLKIKVKFIQYIYFYSDLRRIDFKTEIFPSGKHFRLRVVFPTSIKRGKVYAEIPFGNIKRPEGEFPAQNWICYEDSKKGIILLNEGLPGNNVTDGVMILSLLRSVDIEHKGLSEEAFEQGIHHRFNYSIFPYAKDTKKDFSFFSKQGFEFNNPLISRELNFSPHKASKETSFIKLSPENVVLSAIRKVENGVIFRIYEAKGKRCKGRIEFSKIFKIGEIEETDFLGRRKKAAKIKDNILEFTLSPYQIKTFKLKAIM